MMTHHEMREWRIARRWTQAQAAEALGFTRRGYQDAELRSGPISRTLELAIAGYEASEARVSIVRPSDRFVGDDRVTCYLEFDRITDAAALLKWAVKWGPMMANDCRQYFTGDERHPANTQQRPRDSL